MPANILDPDNDRIRNIINLPDSRLELLNFGIVDDGAGTLNFQFNGTDILSLKSDGDLTFDKDVTLNGSLTFTNPSGADPVLSSNSSAQTLTLEGNLEMTDADGIIFDSFTIQNEQAGGNTLLFEAPSGANGVIEFVAKETSVEFGLIDQLFLMQIRQLGSLPNTVGFNIITSIVGSNDTGDEPLMQISFSKGGGLISARPLLEIRNVTTQAWLLDNDGTVTQTGNLVMTAKNIENVNELQFGSTPDWTVSATSSTIAFIPNTTGDFSMKMGIANTPFFEFSYVHSIGISNPTFTVEILGANQFFTTSVFVSTTSNDASTIAIAKLELESEAGPITTRPFYQLTTLVSATETIQFEIAPTSVNIVGKNLKNAVMTATVTGVSEITGLGSQEQDLLFDANVGITLNAGTIDLGFGNISNANIVGSKRFDIIGALDEVPILNSFFTQTTSGSPAPPNQIFVSTFSGVTLDGDIAPYSQIIVTQNDLTNGAQKGNIDFLVAVGGAPSSMLKLNGTSNRIETSADLLTGANIIMSLNEIIFEKWKVRSIGVTSNTIAWSIEENLGIIDHVTNLLSEQLIYGNAYVQTIIQDFDAGLVTGSIFKLIVESNTLSDTGVEDSVISLNSQVNGATAITDRDLLTIENLAVIAWSIGFDGIVTQTGRLLENKGTDIASTTSLILPVNGNTFFVTGTVDISFINTVKWQSGSKITLLFTEGVKIINDASGAGTNTAPIFLDNDMDHTVNALGGTLTLVLDLSNNQWIEISRSDKVDLV